MDFIDTLLEMLRGKSTAADPLQEDQNPDAMADGVAALSDPAYAAYVREAKASGEPVMDKKAFARFQAGS